MTAARPPFGSARRHTAWPARRLLGTGLAIELGSARTRAWAPGRGVLLDVPTVAFPGTGASYPIQRGTIVDAHGTARMLDRLLSRRIPRCGRPLIVLTTPVLSGPGYRASALTALEALRPRTVLTVPTARAIALGAYADLTRPLLIVDIGAHLTEVALLTDGEVTNAYRTALGTSDLDETVTFREITRSVITMVTVMLRRDLSSQTVDALRRGVLLAGGGAVRPEFAHHLTGQLRVPVRPASAPRTVALRGAARILESAHRHPSITATTDADHPSGN
ncbi:rod shape-determining protein [Streptomyces sp. NPDC059909]|uniref:rod shape-determining protein n=1 Tax=Streptomyces sp. NPDC059909 TaxID=3346998 RepID=UPI0036650DCA